jgi:hypothetical protein
MRGGGLLLFEQKRGLVSIALVEPEAFHIQLDGATLAKRGD